MISAVRISGFPRNTPHHQQDAAKGAQGHRIIEQHGYYLEDLIVLPEKITWLGPDAFQPLQEADTDNPDTSRHIAGPARESVGCTETIMFGFVYSYTRSTTGEA